METFDLQIKYKSQERSKDSNGSMETITIEGNNMSYEISYWGFKSENALEDNKKTTISDNEIDDIKIYLEQNKLNKNINKEIKDEKNGSRFNTFTYLLANNYKKEQIIIEISSNNSNVDNDVFGSLRELFFKLKLMFI
ncbi:MAG: hypothetical protein JXL97_05325 [Bacteroidales bacterium]|nr:hypothetical protein [Bacteroidales bacterium]